MSRKQSDTIPAAAGRPQLEGQNAVDLRDRNTHLLLVAWKILLESRRKTEQGTEPQP